MIIDTIKLSVTNDTTIRLSGNTQCALDGRRLKRSATGGRFFVVADNVINVRLERSGEYRNQELTLTPPVSVVINGNQKYDGVTKLEFIGDTMRVNSNADQIRRENVNRLNAEVQNLAGQEKRLNQELSEKQEAIRQLEAANLAAERQIAQLSGTVASLRQQTEVLENVNGRLVNLQNDLNRVSTELASAQSQAETLNSDFAQQTAERDRVIQDNEVMAAAIVFLQDRLANEKRQYDTLKQQEDTLNAELRNYSPEAVEKLRNAIQALQDQHAGARAEWTRLSGEKRVWERSVEDQRNANEELAQEIAQQPDELKQLQESHEALSRRLTEIVNAQELCSEENQKELRRQIDEQEPVAQKLTEQYQALENHAAELTGTIENLRQAKDAELLRLYPQLTQGLEQIKGSVGEMNTELENLSAEAEQFATNVQACAERMERLNEWYQVDKTPLQRLRERLGDMTSSENEQLMQTMNPANVDRVSQLFESVEAGLAELDDILHGVIRSAQNDEKFINLKTTTNDQHARQEMKRQS